MLIIPWIDTVPIAMIAGSDSDVVVSASSPCIFSAFLNEKSEELRKQKKLLDFLLLVMFKGSSFVLFIKDKNDIPDKDIFDPGTGKLWIKYEVDQKSKALIRIE
jgi:hypothetical protein